MKPRILIWYRHDLRLHDHEPLHTALKQSAIIVPLYCFDPRQFGETHFGFPKTGAFRAQFLRESIQDLQRSFQKLGSALIIRVGKPESIIPTLIEPLHITSVYYHTEITTEEQVVELALQRSLQMHHIPYRAFWGNTLYHPDDLPFDRSNIPELFTTFRKQVEKHANIQPALPSPQTLCPWHLPSEGSTPTSPPSTVEIGDIPRLGDTLGDFNLQPIVPDPRAVLAFQGGETAGLTRLQQYFWQRDQLRHYKETRNGLLGADYSSKFSAWLAAGCLSPRYIYQQVRQYERERVQNDSTYWLIFELLWRDYFQLISAKHGDRIFYRSGLQRLPIAWKQDWQRFDLWRAGKTGYPFVDANLKELAATGFMSNRGRQNVASFLTKNLGIDWRMGAEWFESTLIDYDVCSNWGNWNYSAGIGNDARGFRFFNITKQAQTYDPEGSYVKHWLPELVAIPAARIHEPWKLSRDEQKQYGVRLGVDYPHPIVDLLQSAATEEKRYKEAIARR